MGNLPTNYLAEAKALPDEYASNFSEEKSIEAVGDVLAPQAPSNVAATFKPGLEAIRVSWDDPTKNYDLSTCNDLSHKRVYYATTSGIQITDSNTYDGYINTDTDVYLHETTPAESGTTYYFVISAIDNSDNESMKSSEVSATVGDTTPPDPISNASVSITNISYGIKINWTNPDDPSLYKVRIYYSDSTGIDISNASTYDSTVNVMTDTWYHTELAKNQTQYYKMTTVDKWGNESTATSEVNETFEDITAPSTPTNFTATGNADGINVTWTNPTEPDFHHVNVYYSTSSGIDITNSGTYDGIKKTVDESWLDEMSTGIDMYYKATAVDQDSNESSATSEASATSGGSFVICGMEWNQTDNTFKYINEDGTEATTRSQSDFADYVPWGSMRRVNLNSSGDVVAVKGEGSFAEDGSNGWVMVQIPKFWVKTETETTGGKTYYRWWISGQAAQGYVVHPAFYQRNSGDGPADFIYVGAYEAIKTTISGDTRLDSESGRAPMSGESLSDAETWGNSPGTGWGAMNPWSFSVLIMLNIIEYAGFDVQTNIGKGLVDTTSKTNTGVDSITGNLDSEGTGSGTGTDGQTPVAYRWLENLWGNLATYLSGFAGDISNDEYHVADNGAACTDYDPSTWSATDYDAITWTAHQYEHRIATGSIDDEAHCIDRGGNQFWAYTGHSNNVNDIVIDDNGYIYTASDDHTVKKLDRDGSRLWSYALDSYYDALSLIVKSNGNVYVAGYRPGVNGKTWEISSGGSGTLLGNGSGEAKAMDIDSNGNFYFIDGSLLISYDSSMTWRWNYGAPVNNGYGVAVDGSDYIYFTTGSKLWKINSSGTKQWDKTLSGTLHRVTVDDNYVYTCGSDGNVWKYNFAGTLQWSHDIGSVNAYGIAVDPWGFVYVGADSTLYKLDQDGNEVGTNYTSHSGLIKGVDVFPGHYAQFSGSWLDYQGYDSYKWVSGAYKLFLPDSVSAFGSAKVSDVTDWPTGVNSWISVGGHYDNGVSETTHAGLFARESADDTTWVGARVEYIPQ